MGSLSGNSMQPEPQGQSPAIALNSLAPVKASPVMSTRSPRLISALRLTGLTQLLDQLEQSDNWENTLNPEQQQRLGLVRLLLYKPKWVLLEAAFDSLSAEDEVAMFRLICQQLPDAAILTISHQAKIAAFHHTTISL